MTMQEKKGKKAMKRSRKRSPASPSVRDFVYVGFNSQVIALHRDTGELAWHWSAPEGSGFVALLIDGDRLLVSVEGYTYCLQPLTGKGLWYNRLMGYGTGIPSLASVHGSSNQLNPSAVAALVEEERRRSG